MKIFMRRNSQSTALVTQVRYFQVLAGGPARAPAGRRGDVGTWLQSGLDAMFSADVAGEFNRYVRYGLGRTGYLIIKKKSAKWLVYR
jgi:hypothetical protein